MANRHTLHKNDLENFRQWLDSTGWQILEPKGDFEVLRARRYDYPRPLLVHRGLGGGEHYSIDERDMRIYRAYYQQKNRSHHAKVR